MEIRAAILRLSRFSKWNSSDFTAGALDVDIVGGDIVSRSKNRIIVGIKNPKKFKLQVRGFDKNRDLRVRATKAFEE